jgi:hypothetical protein
MGRTVAGLLRAMLAFVGIYCAYQASVCVWQSFAGLLPVSHNAIWFWWWSVRATLLLAPWPCFLGLIYLAYWLGMTPEEKEQERQWMRQHRERCRLERMMAVRSSMNVRLARYRVWRP